MQSLAERAVVGSVIEEMILILFADKQVSGVSSADRNTCFAAKRNLNWAMQKLGWQPMRDEGTWYPPDRIIEYRKHDVMFSTPMYDTIGAIGVEKELLLEGVTRNPNDPISEVWWVQQYENYFAMMAEKQDAREVMKERWQNEILPQM